MIRKYYYLILIQIKQIQIKQIQIKQIQIKQIQIKQIQIQIKQIQIKQIQIKQIRNTICKKWLKPNAGWKCPLLKKVNITWLLEKYNWTIHDWNSYICSLTSWYCIVSWWSKNWVRSSWFTIDWNWLSIHLKNWATKVFDVTEYCWQSKWWYWPMKSWAYVKFKISCTYTSNNSNINTDKTNTDKTNTDKTNTDKTNTDKTNTIRFIIEVHIMHILI